LKQQLPYKKPKLTFLEHPVTTTTLQVQVGKKNCERTKTEHFENNAGMLDMNVSTSGKSKTTIATSKHRR